MQKNQANLGKIGVIDIGSNSIRLVIFDKYGRYPYPLFNERITCKLGYGVQQTKMLQKDRIDHALETIGRFSKIVKSAGLGSIHVIATAASRQAINASEFLEPAEMLLGCKIRVLSGKEEASLVARGLIANIPKADGIIADLGGGSLELIRVQKGEVKDTLSLNFGHLSDIKNNDFSNYLKKLNWENNKGKNYFYGVGGSFRALGMAYRYKKKYPIESLHGLTLSMSKTKRILNKIIKNNGILKGIPSSRKETMSNAAKIMNIVLNETQTKNIMICGTSVRDGVVLESLASSKFKKDPLLTTCKEIAKRTERFSGLSKSLEKLLKCLIAIGDKKDLKRLLKAACLLADISWNENINSRAFRATERILLLPVNSITHRERAWLSRALYFRYARQFEMKKFPFDFKSILNKEDLFTALVVGLALRFAMTLSAGLPELIKNIQLDINSENLTVECKGQAKILLVDHVHGRLKFLSDLLDRKLVIKS